jgi:hypothetical protein
MVGVVVVLNMSFSMIMEEEERESSQWDECTVDL